MICALLPYKEYEAQGSKKLTNFTVQSRWNVNSDSSNSRTRSFLSYHAVFWVAEKTAL
jgi:hypothetical protein